MHSAVPALERIRIYPMKSLNGVDVEHAPVLASGALAWDRRYALHDEQGAVINGKRCPRCTLCASSGRRMRTRSVSSRGPARSV